MRQGQPGIAVLYYAYGDGNKKQKAISHELANSDPLGASYFDYSVTPYKGYTYTLGKGYSRDGVIHENGWSDYLKSIMWDGGELEYNATRFSDCPYVAIPIDPKNPAFHFRSGRAYMVWGDPYYSPSGPTKGWEMVKY